MKKNLFFLALFLAFALGTTVMADSFATVTLSYPEGDTLYSSNYEVQKRILMRYADDKTPIALSSCHDGNVYAKIPQENQSRPVEVFMSDIKAFTDDNGEYEFYIMRQLSSRGIIEGDTEGRANPLSNITRAEAAAIVMRTFGLESSPDANAIVTFNDVSKNDWFYGVVMSAYKNRIITGDSKTTFSPNRPVSNEEMVCMIARAIWSCGLQIEKVATLADLQDMNIYDAGKVSPWAYNAYKTLNTFTIGTWVENGQLNSGGEPEYAFYAAPQEYTTRFNACNVLFRVCDNYTVYATPTAVAYGFDKEMPIIDGSTSTFPFTQAVYRNLFYNGYYHPGKPEAHSKSHAAYQRLISGEVDMLFASVYPASDILELAKEKGVELELIPIAYDAMIFFTNAQNSATGLTSEQISNIYVNNAYRNWNEIGGPDALLYPYCRNNDSGSHAQMERHFLNGNEINEKIRQETTSVTMSNVLTDVLSAQTDNPLGYGLGYSIYYYFNNMDLFYNTHTTLKLLAIDGVYPTDETIASGSYPLSNNTCIVIRSDEEENSPARKMIDFMLSDKGQECVVEAGYGPLKK